MANAMLEEDYKSSHQDLTTFASVDEDEPKMNHHHHEEKNHRPVNDHRKPAAAASLPTRKSVDFAILPPAKRSKPNNHHRASWTAKQVVDGTSGGRQYRNESSKILLSHASASLFAFA
jgi:hypothetical protein